MSQYFRNLEKNKKGIAALLTVIIVGASTLAMVIGATFLGSTSMDAGGIYIKGGAALAAAEGCAREGLRRLKIDPGYNADNMILPIGDKYCIINIDSNGSESVISTVGVSEGYYKRIRVLARISGETHIKVLEWNEE